MNKLQARQKLGNSKLTSSRNQCPSCGELFNSDAAFDKHRKPTSWFVGISKEESKTLPILPRRCLSIEEMIHIGMLKNPQGFWVTSMMPKEYLNKLTQDKEEEELEESEELDDS